MSSFWATRVLLLRYVALIYCVAFLVALNQNEALLSSRGLLPVHLVIPQILKSSSSSFKAFQRVPTLLLFVPSEYWDSSLQAIATAGLALSAAVLVSGAANMIVMSLLWLMYHSLVNVGQRWYSFGWESQLLESGFLAIWLCPVLTWTKYPNGTPPSKVVIWGYRWLIFRIMIGAGLIKIRGDKCWHDLTCMLYHYETQPVPNPLAYYLHQSPEIIHKIEVAGNHFIELIAIAPWLLIAPHRKCAMVGGAIQIAFQVVLILSGNLSFLNWLTILPCLACFDDQFLGYSQSHHSDADESSSISTRFRQFFHGALFCLLAYLSIPVVMNLLSANQAMNTSFDNFRLVNTYGAFGSITKTRTEIVMQGTNATILDGNEEWYDYEFKCKPTSLTRRPCVITPYHYRLDWLMWFAAFQAMAGNVPWTFIACLTAFWLTLWLVARWIDTRRAGVYISVCQVRVTLPERFSSCFDRLSRVQHGCLRRLVQIWFSLGAMAATVLLGASTISLTIIMLNQSFTHVSQPPVSAVSAGGRQTTASQPYLVPLLPGSTVPWSHTPAALVAVFLAVLWHELGHALCSAVQNVPVRSFGVVLLCIYPGAYTELDSEALDALHALVRLRIYCAGIWHNLVAAALCVALGAAPLLFPLYSTTHGLLVTSVHPLSPLAGPKGLSSGDVINAIGGCSLLLNSLDECLTAEVKSGYCIPAEHIETLSKSITQQAVLSVDELEMECCMSYNTSTASDDEAQRQTESRLCFYGDMLEPEGSAKKRYVCLPVRRVLYNFATRCASNTDCDQPINGIDSNDAFSALQSSNLSPTCLAPATFNSTRLFVIHLRNNDKPVLYVGQARDILSGMLTSHFSPRFHFLSTILPPSLPLHVSLFIHYSIVISLGLSMLNAFPVHYLDGVHILKALLEMCITDSKYRRRIYVTIMRFGLIVFVLNLVLAFVNIYRGVIPVNF